MTLGYLERLAARSASVGSVLCLGLDPDPEALPDGLHPGPRRGRAIRPVARRGRSAVRRRDQAEPGVLRGLRIERDRGAGAHPARRSRATSWWWPMPSAGTSARPPPARRSPCSTALVPMRSPSTRTSGRRRSRRSSIALIGSPTCSVVPPTRGRRVAGSRRRGRSARRGPGRTALRPGRATRDRLGSRWDRGSRRRRDRPHRAGSHPRDRARAGLPRARRRRTGWGGRSGHGRRPRERGARRWTTRRRAAGQRVAGDRFSRRPSRRPATDRRTSASDWRRRPSTGPDASLCYPDPRITTVPNMLRARC